MKDRNLSTLIIIVVTTVFFITILLSGCDNLIPNPNPPEDQYDKENTEAAYIKVFPNKVEMTLTQSQYFEAKAYNSDNRLVALDLSKIKWTCTYECIACGVVCNVSPVYGSARTMFKPTSTEKKGHYEVWAKYEEAEKQWAKADVTVR